MNTFKKSVLAIATVSTLALAAAAPAQAGPNWWKKPLAQGIGFGVGLGITNAILQPRPQPTYVVQQRCFYQQRQVINQWGQVSYQNVQVCQ